MYIIYNTTHAHTHIHTHPCDPTKKKRKKQQSVARWIARSFIIFSLNFLFHACPRLDFQRTSFDRQITTHTIVWSPSRQRLHSGSIDDTSSPTHPSLTVPNVRPHDRTTALHARARITLSPRNWSWNAARAWVTRPFHGICDDCCEIQSRILLRLIAFMWRLWPISLSLLLSLSLFLPRTRQTLRFFSPISVSLYIYILFSPLPFLFPFSFFRRGFSFSYPFHRD